MNLGSGSSPVAWCDVQCWAKSFSSLCSLWWGHAGCHSGAPSQSGRSWWTGGSLRSVECWWIQHTVKKSTDKHHRQVCLLKICSLQDLFLVPVCVGTWVSTCVYLRFLRKDAGSFASSVLTSPNSCMTLSSCLRSSWPFNRNMNSWPLLPADGAIKYALMYCPKSALCKIIKQIVLAVQAVFYRVHHCYSAAASASPETTSNTFDLAIS